MKKIIILYSLLIFAFGFCQDRTISGIIKDAKTNEPIEKVSISIVGTNSGTLSNEEGKFKIVVPNGFSNISFSHINYEIKDYLVTNTTDVEIMLKAKEYVLDDVVINHKSGRKSLIDAIDASKAKLEKSLLLNTYYREFIKVDNKYCSFADGLLDYFIKRKSGASDVYVKQSRVYDMKDANASERQKAIQTVTFNDVRSAVKEAYNFKYVSEILKSENYNFQVETQKDAKGNSIDIITIEPKEDIEKESIYTGTVTYDTKTKLILDIDLKYSEEHKKYAQTHSILFIKFKFNDISRRSSFKIDGDKYVLIYNQNKSNIYVKFGSTVDNTFESLSDLTVLDYKEGEFNLDKSKKYKTESLFTNGNTYTEKFWEKYNIMLLNANEEKIIKELNNK